MIRYENQGILRRTERGGGGGAERQTETGNETDRARDR